MDWSALSRFWPEALARLPRLMAPRRLSLLMILPVLALGACGGKTKNVNAAGYTCAQFNKSLNTKGDNSAGNYINQLIKRAKLGQSQAAERREVTLGIYFACRSRPGSTRPATRAVAIAKQLKAGKYNAPKPQRKKKSGK
jgi:hypothetical protein